jgi:hypothetical protein
MDMSNTITIVAPHETFPAKLAAVKAEMEKLGPPTIRAFFNGEIWLAVEGSHRIAAAAELGIPVEIDPMKWDDEITHDMEDVSEQTVSAVLEYLEMTGPRYEVEKA